MNIQKFDIFHFYPIGDINIKKIKRWFCMNCHCGWYNSVMNLCWFLELIRCFIYHNQKGSVYLETSMKQVCICGDNAFDPHLRWATGRGLWCFILSAAVGALRHYSLLCLELTNEQQPAYCHNNNDSSIKKCQLLSVLAHFMTAKMSSVALSLVIYYETHTEDTDSQ